MILKKKILILSTVYLKNAMEFKKNVILVTKLFYQMDTVILAKWLKHDYKS